MKKVFKIGFGSGYSVLMPSIKEKIGKEVQKREKKDVFVQLSQHEKGMFNLTKKQKRKPVYVQFIGNI